MSSDDYIAIIRERNKYSGYWLSASQYYPTLKSMKQNRRFKVKSIEEAILEAQKIETEYGYTFVNLKVKKQ